jgi:predicted  nucleic acid-binding Zn-ribbon protein
MAGIGGLDQIVFGAGSLSITVAVLWTAVKTIQSKLAKLEDRFSRFELKLEKNLKELEEKHYGLKAEIAEKYLRRDEWLAHHNKMEAGLKTEIKELKELLHEVLRKTG